MQNPRVRAAVLAAAGLCVAASALRLSARASALERARDQVEAGAARLGALARETRIHSSLAARDRAELMSLRAMAEQLPQERGYLRTHKVIADEVEALRRRLAPRLKGQIHIIIDAKANKLYLKKGLSLLWEADVSVGRGGVLVDKKTGRRWEFVTPRGEFRVVAKAENPLWRKPDWAYTETGEPIPPPDDPARLVEGELGAYVLNLGDGYLIHGTKNEALLGRPASHGCVRLGAADLKKLYEQVSVGARVFVFY